ncbi:MAG: FAD-dependent oxidoreductase [Candidatus Omnitrophica bacterium]|nr:FAD-dependent oxidoreductase [Candidatus Omnitrophota bacterium]
MYDLIIIGAGPAGITAAVYAARKKMDFLVLTGDIGGQTIWSSNVENYTGYQFITGVELAQKFEEHMRQYKISVRENEPVISLEKAKDFFTLTTAKAVYQSRTVIIASGKRSRELGVAGEKEFRNKGLTYCATCDGPLFSGKDVAIVGNGNSALDAALQMVRISPRVYIINKVSSLSGDAVMREKAISAKNITVINDATVTEILGDKLVTKIRIKRNRSLEEIPVQGVFVEIGLIPNSDFASLVKKNDLGELEVDCRNSTSVEGIFAAGDVTSVPEKQIIIAAGEGAKAALSSFRYLAGHKF